MFEIANNPSNADKVGFINTHGVAKMVQRACLCLRIYTTFKHKTPKYTKIAILVAKLIMFLVPDLIIIILVLD
jgi:hypothetical protein